MWPRGPLKEPRNNPKYPLYSFIFQRMVLIGQKQVASAFKPILTPHQSIRQFVRDPESHIWGPLVLFYSKKKFLIYPITAQDSQHFHCRGHNSYPHPPILINPSHLSQGTLNHSNGAPKASIRDQKLLNTLNTAPFSWGRLWFWIVLDGGGLNILLALIIQPSQGTLIHIYGASEAPRRAHKQSKVPLT